ncbi:MAG: excinuclease ABC subunit UvrB [Candidatus Paceibacterota bacterium]
MDFHLKTDKKPAGDQPQAISSLLRGLDKKNRFQTLLGVTGSGKTFTMANVIAKTGRPALVIAHNKTLAAQLTSEFRDYFPDNAVEYFVSYYDYYQPEAYLPSSDTYIEKESQINAEIDRLRHSATEALLTRRDVIVVASVSCIYGLGSPILYKKSSFSIKKGDQFDRALLMRELIKRRFTRSSGELTRGEFRVRGRTFDIFPSNREIIYRLDLSGEKISSILLIDPLKREVVEKVNSIMIFPTTHFVSEDSDRSRALSDIKKELSSRLKYFEKNKLLLEAERLERRTNYDLAMIREVGYSNGIENYSRHFDGRAVGSPPFTLLDYFPDDFLLFIDESHVTLPQLNGMYNGDHARKKALIDNGFRLPSAYDNRPLKFDEFEKKINQAVFVSATPADFEKNKSAQIVEQIIRPTGLIDPEIIIRPITSHLAPEHSRRASYGGQVADLIEETKKRALKKERVIATTLTKKTAEDLAEYLKEQGVKTKYLHSEVETLDRIRLLAEFREGKFDCLVGVNLLREGLDLPEVTLVAILDADKEGFLRSETSLIQTIGRAARNVFGQVILYADIITGSIKRAVSETNRRREIQIAYNKKHGITPETIKKEIKDITKIWGIKEKDVKKILNLELDAVPLEKIPDLIKDKELEMRQAAQNLEFELAAILRDEISLLKKKSKSKK